MRLVPDVSNWWKWFSTHGLALATAVQATWIALPDDLKMGSPDWLVNAVTIVILLGTFLGRITEQPSLPRPKSPRPKSSSQDRGF